MIHGRIHPPKGLHRSRPLRRWASRDPAVTRILIAACLGLSASMLLFLAPALLFLEQNYEIFTQLAYDIKPGLVGHLEREVLWMRVFLIAGGIGTIVVAVHFVRRLMMSLIEPVERIDRHLGELTRGQWSLPAPSAPHDEAFREIFLSYQHFHRTLIAETERNLSLLENIKIDPEDRESFSALNQLIESHRGHLGLGQGAEIIDFGASSSEADSSRRAS